MKKPETKTYEYTRDQIAGMVKHAVCKESMTSTWQHNIEVTFNPDGSAKAVVSTRQ